MAGCCGPTTGRFKRETDIDGPPRTLRASLGDWRSSVQIRPPDQHTSVEPTFGPVLSCPVMALFESADDQTAEERRDEDDHCDPDDAPPGRPSGLRDRPPRRPMTDATAMLTMAAPPTTRTRNVAHMNASDISVSMAVWTVTHRSCDVSSSVRVVIAGRDLVTADQPLPGPAGSAWLFTAIQRAPTVAAWIHQGCA